jgi:hypothetical protein
VQQVFKYGLFIVCGVLNNPKAEDAYRIAYEERHGGGYGDIASFFDDLVDLIR